MENKIKAAQQLAYTQWRSTLPYLTRFKKLKEYGAAETAESLWNKLPSPSHEFWLLEVK